MTRAPFIFFFVNRQTICVLSILAMQEVVAVSRSDKLTHSAAAEWVFGGDAHFAGYVNAEEENASLTVPRLDDDNSLTPESSSGN